MWPRTLTTSIGMDEEAFTEAFIKALHNEAVLSTLKEIFTLGLRKEISELKELVKAKETKIKELEKQVCNLELNCDALEQYSRRNSIRISGLKENEHENPVETALDLINNKMDIDMTTSALDRVHRIGKKKEGTTRPLLVKFATYRERYRVYKAKQRLKSEGTTRIFVNEDLTRKRSLLLYKARQMKRRKLIQDCWSYDGQILIKDSRGKVIPINSDDDLENFNNDH